MKIWLLRR